MNTTDNLNLIEVYVFIVPVTMVGIERSGKVLYDVEYEEKSFKNGITSL